MSAALWLAGCGQFSSSGPAPGSTDAASEALDLSMLTAEQRQSVEAFYRNKTVRIIVGSGAGGGFDTTARLVSRHLAKYIPGSPTVIVENRPGGGGMVAANHLYNAAPKDGLNIGIFPEVQVMNQWIDAEGVQFDLRKFNWLGSSYDDPNVCIVRTDANISSFKELIGGGKQIAVGGTGPGSNTYDVPSVIAAATGANIKAVAGYPTSNDVRIGIERGELQGICYGWESVRSAAGQWLDSKFVHVIVQNGAAPHKDLPGVPMARDFAKDENSRTLLRLVDAPGAMAKAFLVPPGVDESRVQMLRAALAAAYRDPVLIAEAKAMNLEFQPKSAEQIQEILEDVLAAPPQFAALYQQIIEPSQ
jgi:tripartite-type tricarboxylate transporter receptor subunit TctC